MKDQLGAVSKSSSRKNNGCFSLLLGSSCLGGHCGHKERKGSRSHGPHGRGSFSLIFFKLTRAQPQNSPASPSWRPGRAPCKYGGRIVNYHDNAGGCWAALKLRLSIRGDNKQNPIQQLHLTIHFRNRADITKHKYFSAYAYWLTCTILPL